MKQHVSIVRALKEKSRIAGRIHTLTRACGGGDIPAKLVRSTARLLKLTPVEFAQAAARLNRPFVTSHVR